ncbi:MAG TPA: glycosyl hydrolase 108 family protein [Tepidisphaeraceae bacterium]|nr:glycosyl hydrolase 108 family protein [Tepidisphaeraceae bacterium]
MEFDRVVMIEGGYVNSPTDSGGATKFGITEAVALAHGYVGAMKDLPLETAKDIYRVEYWNQLNLDPVSQLSQPLAHELFDTGVNCGIGTASRFLKRALNALNRGGKDWADVPLDSPIGPQTLHALQRLHVVRGEEGLTVLLRMLNAQQSVRYLEIAERRPRDEVNEFGWQDNRVS